LLEAKVDYNRYVDSLQKSASKMSLYDRLRLVELKQKTGIGYSLDSLLSKQSRTAFGNVYWGEEGYRFFDNSIQNTILMYRVLKTAGGHEAVLEKARGYFLEKRNTGAWRNTYESSLILETILPDVLVHDSLPRSASLQLSGGTQQTVTQFPFSTVVRTGGNITVSKGGGLPVYFTAYQQRWNPAPQKVESDFVVQSSFEKSGRAVARLKAGEPVVMNIAVSVKADADYVLVEAPIPAGCSYNGKAQPRGAGEVHREHFKAKVSIFCSHLKKGDYTFAVSLLPRYTGQYTLNPAKAEMMYFPVFYGREGMKKVVIE
jgi:alpha-2-macroglobulin